jgi:GAF domain-containing protein
MFGRNNHVIPAASYRRARDVVFLELRHTVFCTECELISYNNSSKCLACGSVAVMSLSRVLGGSLRGEQTTRMVDQYAPVVEASKPPARVDAWSPQTEPAYALAMQAHEHMATPAASAVSMLQFGVDRAHALTGASGAAVALQHGEHMVCRARAGRTAPDLGAHVPNEGLTALCARTGQAWRCNDTEREPWVNRDSCRRLGIRSVVVAPMLAVRRVLGILEVFSPEPSAFDDQRAATVQLMASAIALATLRHAPAGDSAAISNLQPEQ